MEQISGVVAFLKVYKGNWGLASVKLDDGAVMRCVGASVAGLKRGRAYQFKGHTKHHEKWGLQFDVEAVDGDSSIKVPRPRKSKSTTTRRTKRSAPYAAATRSPKRARRRKAAPIVDLDPPPPNSGNSRIDRIKCAAYDWGKKYFKQEITVSLDDLELAIYAHLCETLVWKELGKTCRIQAANAAKEILAFAAKAKSGVGPAKCYEDIAIILMYESAHHIGITHLESRKDIDRDTFTELVIADLNKNTNAEKKFLGMTLRAAAIHAANELLC